MKISDSKILIVDDEVDLAELVVESFGLEGFTAEKALSGEDALKRCEAEHFDVIVSDQNMSGINGLDLLKALKEKSSKNFLFYLCSGEIDLNLEDFKQLGGTDIVSKPYDLFALVERIKRDLEEI